MTNKEDAIDVEFETVQKDGAQPVKKPTSANIKEDSSDNDEQLAVFGKMPNKKKQSGMSLPVFTLVAAVCSVTAFYLAGGHVLFENAQPIIVQPETQPLLQFQNISTNRLARDGSDVLTIEATIINNDKIARVLPPVIVHIGDDPTKRRMFRINRGETLNPGERLMFTNSLPVGKGNSDKAELTFAE
ncbi:hypothetical protein WNY59_13365 [Ahrensia kielensis]|uniref:DUF3426 domain-containing protein n=1 Tax=Ahrensia kielensis TaxID=76980 RepID=A0ABU9T8W8_9HYPH